MVKVRCETTQGDAEVVDCLPVGHNVRVVLGSMLTALGKPIPGNGVLEVRGDDKVKVTYSISTRPTAISIARCSRKFRSSATRWWT